MQIGTRIFLGQFFSKSRRYEPSNIQYPQVDEEYSYILFQAFINYKQKIQLSFVPICNHLQIDIHAIVGLLQSADITEYESERETREFIREEAVK